MFKVNNKGFFVNFEHITYLVLVFSTVDFEHVNAS